MLTPFLKRPLQKPLTGLELPRHKAVYRLADKPSRGAVAQFGQIVCELSQLGEGVHRGAADLRPWRAYQLGLGSEIPPDLATLHCHS